MCTKRCAHEHTGQRRTSDIPCAMALRLITCSPRRTALLPPLRPGSCCLQMHRRQHRDVGTTRLRRTFQSRSSVATSTSTASPSLASDDGQRPSERDGMAKDVCLICPSGKANYFLFRVLTRFLVIRSHLGHYRQTLSPKFMPFVLSAGPDTDPLAGLTRRRLPRIFQLHRDEIGCGHTVTRFDFGKRLIQCLGWFRNADRRQQAFRGPVGGDLVRQDADAVARRQRAGRPGKCHRARAEGARPGIRDQRQRHFVDAGRKFDAELLAVPEPARCASPSARTGV